MLVKDLMTVSISCLSPDDRICAAVGIMRSENVGAVPVCDVQKHVLGIVTDRDIIMRAAIDSVSAGADGSASAELPCLVRDVMSSDVISVDSKDDVHDAALLMSKHAVRRLPVVENGKLVGMLSIKDMAKKRVFIAEIGHVIYELSNQS